MFHNSKEVLALAFQSAANNPDTIITVIARDQNVLKAWLLAEAIEIVETNPDLKQYFEYNKTQRYFKFHNGSYIQFLAIGHPNDAKCGIQHYLIIDREVNGQVNWELRTRTRYSVYVV